MVDGETGDPDPRADQASTRAAATPDRSRRHPPRQEQVETRALAAEQKADRLRARAENVAIMLDLNAHELDDRELALLARLWEAIRG
jgi:hypothetical protein